MTINNFVKAGMFIRFLGGIIDLIVLIIFSCLFGYLTNTAHVTNESYSLSGVPFLLSLLLCLFIFAIMEYFTGKTPGKYCTATKVISEDGNKITILQALVRNVARFIDGFGFYIFGFIIICLTKDRRRLGDLMAKTFVINT